MNQCMALESVDLLSLLKRARKSTADAAAGVAAAATATATAEEPEVVAAPLAPADAPVAKGQENEGLTDLYNELFSDELLIRRILGLLYQCKKKNPNGGFISILDMERILNIEREGATFVMTYMKTQKVIEMDDKSRMSITVPGINYLRTVLGVNSGPQATVAAKTGAEGEE